MSQTTRSATQDEAMLSVENSAQVDSLDQVQASAPDPSGSAVTATQSVHGGGKRLAIAVLAGMIAALPIGWLLSFAALLPFLLGLFYFPLLGLIVGAVMYRVGLPACPAPRMQLIVGSAVAVGVTWAVAIIVEGTGFPAQLAEVSLEKRVKLPEGTTADAFFEESRRDVQRFLREEYPPGGVSGYAAWVIRSGRIEPPVGLLQRPYVANQYGWKWIARVFFSLVLLSYGVHSQFGALRRLPHKPDPAETRVNPLSKL